MWRILGLPRESSEECLNGCFGLHELSIQMWHVQDGSYRDEADNPWIPTFTEEIAVVVDSWPVS